MRRSVRTLAVVFFAALGGSAYGASYESVPPECRAQVDAALRALEAGLATEGRPRGAPGSLEAAIARYAPPRLHSVEEGVLPPPRPGSRCSAGMANVGGRFCVDVFEGALLERRDDGTTAPHSPYETPVEGRVYLAESAPGRVPQAYISAAQAARACGAVGKRLCHPVEWRFACGGRHGYAYPYGPTRIAEKCHDRGVAPMMVFHAATLRRGWGPVELNDARLNQLEGTLARTGAFTECVDDYGIHDMVGNLHEWTADPNGTFQGGYWLDTSQHGEGCAYRTIAHPYRYHDYSTGFRCCADATPP